MKNVFKAVIEKGGYDLTSLLKKIDTYHIEGKITDEEKEELYALARKEPKAQYDLAAEIELLWAAVKALQNAGSEPPSEPEVFDWVQPTGAHDAYAAGDVILYTDGKKYKSLIDNNVWSPDTYPSGWEEIA